MPVALATWPVLKGRCPVGSRGVRCVRVAGLFLLSFRQRPVENVIPSLEALLFGSVSCQLLLCLPATWVT